MKIFAFALVGLLCFSTLAIFAVRTEATVTPLWRDDFNYSTKAAMKAAGWVLTIESLIQVGDGTVSLTDDGTSNSGVEYVGLPAGIYDFVAETSAERVGKSTGGLDIFMFTQTHNYSVGGEGYYNTYKLDNEAGNLVSVGGYQPKQDTWENLKVERTGNTINFYVDGTLGLTYNGIDPSPLIGIGMIGGWLLTSKYDYMSLSYTANIILEPSTGFAATTIAGSGFSNNSKVTITWDGTTIPSIPHTLITDTKGSFSALISVPTQTTPGTHTVNATDAAGNWATATFTVVDMKGPAGLQGQQGPKGDTGSQGSTGQQGPKGDTGSQGLKGDTGLQGPPGENQLVLIAFSAGVSILAICLATIALFRKRA